MDNFALRLRRAIDERGPLCVGIDPHPELLARWGLPDTPAGLDRFARIAVDAFADRVAVIKPQSAFFERYGSAGIATLESCIRQLRDAGAIVLLDVKRGDIGSTMKAYARAYLDPVSPMSVDAITVTPYLGFGSLQPVIDAATEHGAGAFVVTRTSNPDGTGVQHARVADGRTVAQQIIDEISQVNAGAIPFGSIGAVIGATVGDTGLDVTKINGPMLAPGLGAQGARAADLRTVFGADLSRVLPSYSREILSSGPSIDALRDVAARVLDECRRVTGNSG
ncbi:MAG TPA: orotidine-5'-phosphate decarboxylase [Micromonosporaceae bacterium]|jgi:orotidine-5'-phosphate decarboxylase|nr:orotidine-5'-phosphate decarboxylase [Micromonosporaceae bacterium]